MSTTAVKFQFPETMHMFHHATWAFTGHKTVCNIQRFIFRKFHQNLPIVYGSHLRVFALSKDIVLRSQGTVIDTEEKLTAVLQQTRTIEAYFAETPFQPLSRIGNKSIDPYSVALEKFAAEFN